MRVTLLVLYILATGEFLHAQCGGPDTEYSLMNATHHRIWVLDLHNSRDGQEWQNLPLQPSQSARFDSALTHVKVRMSSGSVLEYGRSEIIGIRARANVPKGDWIIGDSGLRFISCQKRERTFEALKKYEWPKT